MADRRQRSLAVAAVAAALAALPAAAPAAQARAKCGVKAHHKAKSCRARSGLRPKVAPGLGSRGLDPGHDAPVALEAYPVALRLDGVVR